MSPSPTSSTSKNLPPPQEGTTAHAHSDGPETPHDDLGFDLPPPAKPGRGKIFAAIIGFAIVLGVLFVVGFVPRYRNKAALEKESKETGTRGIRVQVAKPKVKTSDRSLTLPGSIQPLEETIVYARAAGYARKWEVDMGAQVKEGQLLAEIDAPEVDQQMAQARAQLAQSEAARLQAQANNGFANTDLERYKFLTPQGVTSKQQLDEKQAKSEVEGANVKAAQSAVDAQKANVNRLGQLQSFTRVTAPFSGTVVARMIERGALVGPATPLFKIASLDPVRVFVQVPQDLAPSVHVDMPAPVSLREYAGRVFEGKIARTSGALDPMTRTLSAEVRVPNPKNELLTGMYAQVAITLPTPHKVYEIPPGALITDSQGVHLAVATEESKVHLISVVVERDTGPTLEISSGLTGEERIITLASPQLIEGANLEVVEAPAPPVQEAKK